MQMEQIPTGKHPANNDPIEISNPSSTKEDHYAFQFRFSKHIPRVEAVAKQHAKLRSDRSVSDRNGSHRLLRRAKATGQ